MGDPVLKVRLPFVSNFFHEDMELRKRHEMRSKRISVASKGAVKPGDWIWFATLKGKLEGYRGCAVLGCARFVGEEGPLVPRSQAGETRWLQLQHTYGAVNKY